MSLKISYMRFIRFLFKDLSVILIHDLRDRDKQQTYL
jgi:hypothetical protein